MKTKFVWIILYYRKKAQLQIMGTAHATVTAIPNNKKKF